MFSKVDEVYIPCNLRRVQPEPLWSPISETQKWSGKIYLLLFACDYAPHLKKMLLSQWFFYNKPQLWKIASPDCWTSTPNCKGSQLKLLIEQLLNAQMLNELNTNCWKKKKISAKLYHPAVHTYMYNVHCTLCTMNCTYSVQCTMTQ